ncbi:YdcF family protein [Hydrogenimonas sp.]
MIYLLSKLFTALLLPPGLFITVLALLALYIKQARRILGVAALFLYVLSIHPVADRLLAHYEEPFRHTTLPADADAVVVLGGGNIRGNPIPLTDEALKRSLYGLSIAKERDIPLIISGSGEEGYNEFQGLVDSLERLDPLLCADLPISHPYAPGFRIIGETESADTYENARLTRQMIPKERPTLIIVTSAYHMKRALMLFRLAGIEDIHPAAVNFYVEEKSGIEARDLLPSIWAFLNSYRALHEFFGIVKVEARKLLK